MFGDAAGPASTVVDRFEIEDGVEQEVGVPKAAEPPNGVIARRGAGPLKEVGSDRAALVAVGPVSTGMGAVLLGIGDEEVVDWTWLA